MIHYDDNNRVIKIDSDDIAFRGHAVCNKCGKDMPVVWDTICFYCRRTFCYNCATAKNEKWVCNDC